MGCVENKAVSESESVPPEFRTPYWCWRKDPRELTDELLRAYGARGCCGGGAGTVKAKDLQKLFEAAYPEQVCRRQDTELMMRALGVKADGVVGVHQLRAFVRNFYPGSPRIQPKIALLISGQADASGANGVASSVRGLIAHFDIVVSAGLGLVGSGKVAADAASACAAESDKVLHCVETSRLMGILEEAGVTHLYCCGPSLEGGVKSSATQGAAMGFKTTVIQDGCEEQARAELRKVGVRLKRSAEVESEVEKLKISEISLLTYLASLQPCPPVEEAAAAPPRPRRRLGAPGPAAAAATSV